MMVKMEAWVYSGGAHCGNGISGLSSVDGDEGWFGLMREERRRRRRWQWVTWVVSDVKARAGCGYMV